MPEGEDWVVYLLAANQAATERVVFDIDLTKGEAAIKEALKAARGSVVSGAWAGGWRVTAHGQRILLDAGRALPNGLLEVCNEQALSTKLNKVTHKRCEVKAGELGGWATDDQTVMQAKIRWQDGIVSFTTPGSQPTACTNYFQFPPRARAMAGQGDHLALVC